MVRLSVYARQTQARSCRRQSEEPNADRPTLRRQRQFESAADEDAEALSTYATHTGTPLILHSHTRTAVYAIFQCSCCKFLGPCPFSLFYLANRLGSWAIRPSAYPRLAMQRQCYILVLCSVICRKSMRLSYALGCPPRHLSSPGVVLSSRDASALELEIPKG